jgi:hypothetical protein
MLSNRLIISSLVGFFLAMFLVTCVQLDLDQGSAELDGQSTVAPQTYPGNFVASDDDQVCYEIAQMLGWDVTSEMRGFKIDPPTSVSNDAGEFTVEQPYLHWSAADGVRILAVIVKGGPNFNLYDYQSYGVENGYLSADSFLRSPQHRKNIPAISHYNICYQPETVGGEGCTPGYWRNHADRWLIDDLTGSAATNLVFDEFFGVTSGLGSSYTLGQAIWAQGGGVHALARHATAGVLNAYGGVPNADGSTVDYPLSAAQVIDMVRAAIANPDTLEETKDLLDGYNNLGCPLHGTPADRV